MPEESMAVEIFAMKFDRYLTQEDAATLSRLAEMLLRLRDVRFNAAENLIELLATSILLPENAERPDCVTLYSEVAYRFIGSDKVDSMVIVCPHDANAMLAHVSILAPLPMALMGRLKHSIAAAHLSPSKIQFVEIVDVRSLPVPAGQSADPVAEEAID